MRHFRCVIGLLTNLGLYAQAFNGPNDQNFSVEQTEQANCGKACQEQPRQGIETDRTKVFGDLSFDYDFHATATNFSPSRPGDVLKLQQQNTSQMYIPPRSTIFLLQYTSIDTNNTPVPATAFIALPYTPTKGNRYRLVAYAHGTLGYVPACAPSSSYSLYDYFTWQILTHPGYAIVATDYAGLGNNHTTHKYLNPRLNGEDVYFSVIAARKAFPEAFTAEWASIGYSQGGGAVWALSENPRVRSNASGDYRGGVALAPVPRPLDLVSSAVQGEDGGGGAVGGYFPMIDHALSVVNLLRKAEFLSPEGKARMRLIPDLQLCVFAVLELNAGLPNYGAQEDPAQTDENLEALNEYQMLFGAALGKKAYRNLLVIQGTADGTVNMNSTIDAWTVACSAGNIVHLSLYPGVDHDPIIGASAPEWLSWLDAQFGADGLNTAQCSRDTLSHSLAILKIPWCLYKF